MAVCGRLGITLKRLTTRRHDILCSVAYENDCDNGNDFSFFFFSRSRNDRKSWSNVGAFALLPNPPFSIHFREKWKEMNDEATPTEKKEKKTF
ncbi:Uncharacterized protein APZ42_015370 [Daphnia magna]|uniref:Uncharacterized protein n=1 Tax=Daphnia magna TaxID=35525 RepID=A0A162PEM2_9CRUS|nr:Uncharacterized protein APZ42_015370 [Daphnia magna]